MSESLEEILSDKVEDVSAEEQSSEDTKAVETTATEADDKEAEKPPEDKAESKEEPAEESWTKKAALDERRKRQDMERKLDEARQELESLKSKQTEKQEDADVFEDPKGFEQNLELRLGQKIDNIKTEMSRSMMLDAHEDYEEAELKFFDLAKENPLLKQQASIHPHPAKFVYDQVKKHEEFQQIQDGSYKERLRAEIKKELEAEFKAAKDEKASKVANLSPSLANESSSDGQEQSSIKEVSQLFDR